MDNSQTYVQKLHDALLDKERTERTLKEKNREITELCVRLAETMEEEEIDKIDYRGVTYQPKTEENYSLDTDQVGTNKWDDAPQWFDFLRSRGDGDMIKTKESVHPGTRNSYLKKLVSDGEVLPDWIKESFFETVKWTKSKISRIVDGEAA